MAVAAEELPVPEVRELDFEEVTATIEELIKIGKDESIERSDEMNACLAAVPVMHQFVNILKGWGGDVDELPNIESVMHKVELFNNISKSVIESSYVC